MQAIKDEMSISKPVNEPRNGLVLLNKELLPSRGRFYESDLRARKLNAVEVNKLSKVRKDNVNQVFDKTISDAIKGIDVNRIKGNDKLWLIYYLRSITYEDHPFLVRGICKKCNEPKTFEYRLKDLDVTYLEEDLPDHIDLPNGDTVTVEFPDIETEIEVDRTKNNPSFIEDIDQDLLTIASYVKTINGSPVSLYEAYTYFVRGKGNAMDYSRLVSTLRRYAFGARPYAKFKCDCGEEVEAEVFMTQQFFLPEL
jgi:hypothetical protein